MRAVAVEILFEEFVATWTSGEPVHFETLLQRAGLGAEELAGLIDAFLARTPRRGPSAESTRAIAALTTRLEGEPPLLAARIAARKRVRDVTAAIRDFCKLPEAAEQLVRSYYQQLEGGLLDPRGVSDRVWSVLDRVVGPTARKLALDGYFPPIATPATPMVAFQRVADASYVDVAPDPGGPPDGELPSELRREVEGLFIGGETH